jgi:hypothetical protein
VLVKILRTESLSPFKKGLVMCKEFVPSLFELDTLAYTYLSLIQNEIPLPPGSRITGGEAGEASGPFSILGGTGGGPFSTSGTGGESGGGGEGGPKS